MRVDRAIVAGAIAGGLVGLLAISLVVAKEGALSLFDFVVYHDAWGRALAGGTPYDPGTLAGPVGPKAIGSFRYLPPFGVLLSPLALIPREPLTLAWSIASGGVFGIASVVALRPLGLSPVRVALAAGALALTSPVMTGLVNGSVAAFLAPAYLAPLLLAHRPKLAGASLAAAALVRLDAGIVLVAGALAGWRRLFAGGVVAGVALVGLSLIVPSGIAGWIDAPTALGNVAAGLSVTSDNHSMTAPLILAGLPSTLVIGVGSLVAIVAGTLAFRHLPLALATAVAAVAGVAVLPTAWPQAVGALFPVSFAALASAGASARETGAWIVVLTVLAALLLGTEASLLLWVPVKLMLVRAAQLGGLFAR